jgi:AcrR family transcriptional regulator
MAYNRQESCAEDCRTKRQQILDAAYEVFSRKGYNRATVDEIIALADTGKGTVYNYFVNKEQLFFTLISERSQPFERALQQASESDQPATEKIEAMVKLSLRFYKENADLWRVMMHEIRGTGAENVSLNRETHQKYRAGFKRITDLIEKVLNEGIEQGTIRSYNTTKATYSLISVILMMVYQEFIVEDIDTSTKSITDLFMHGLACS